jgi:hypothetical protein
VLVRASLSIHHSAVLLFYSALSSFPSLSHFVSVSIPGSIWSTSSYSRLSWSSCPPSRTSSLLITTTPTPSTLLSASICISNLLPVFRFSHPYHSSRFVCRTISLRLRYSISCILLAAFAPPTAWSTHASKGWSPDYLTLLTFSPPLPQTFPRFNLLFFHTVVCLSCKPSTALSLPTVSRLNRLSTYDVPASFGDCQHYVSKRSCRRTSAAVAVCRS